MFTWLVAGLLVWIVFANLPDRQPSPVTSPTQDQASRKTIYVTGSVVNVREGPSTRFPVVSKVKKGHKLIELSRQDDWVRVTLREASGKAAWIHSSLVSTKRPSVGPTAGAGSKEAPVAASGDILRIVTIENRARLCPKLDCGQDQELLRIPTDTELKVESSSKHRMRLWDVVWYKVTYKGKQGWVSEFNTDKAPKEPRYR